MFLTRGAFAAQETLGKVCRHSGLSHWGGDRGEPITGIQWVGAKDAAPYPTIQPWHPMAKN